MTHVVALVDYKRQNIMQTVFRATYFVKQVHTSPIEEDVNMFNWSGELTGFARNSCRSRMGWNVLLRSSRGTKQNRWISAGWDKSCGITVEM